jgi:hypothetical protein
MTLTKTDADSAVKHAKDAVEEKRRFRDSEYALKIKPLDEDVKRAEQAVAHLEAKLEAMEAAE